MPLPFIPAFTDPLLSPSPELISDALGNASPAFSSLEASLNDDGLTLEWRYYRDGGWLCKCWHKRINLGWICIWEDVSTVTCYFPTRLQPELLQLNFPSSIAEQIVNANMERKSMPIIIEIRTIEDAKVAREILLLRKSFR